MWTSGAVGGGWVVGGRWVNWIWGEGMGMGMGEF